MGGKAGSITARAPDSVSRGLAEFTARLRLRGMSLPLAITLALTVGLVLPPLVMVTLASLKPPDVLPWEASPLVLSNFAAVYSSGVTYTLLANTLVYALGSLVVGIVPALALAWLAERTDMPGRRHVFTVSLVSLGLPPMLTALGWSLWLSPRVGVANLLLRSLLRLPDAQGPLDGYSLGGMVFVTGLVICPGMFVMLAGMFRTMDASLEEAGVMSGGSTLAVWRRITLPLLVPGILAALVYYSITLIQLFDVPLALGLPGRVLVLSTRVYLLTQPSEGDPQYGVAATYALIPLLVGLALMVLYLRTIRRSERFRTITGRGYQPRRTQLGRWGVPATLGVAAFFLVSVGAPLLLLLWVSLLRTYQPPSLDALRSLTLAAYVEVIQNPRVSSAALNTLVLMLTTATAAILLSLLIAWCSVRQSGAVPRLLQNLAFLPLAIPGTVVALAVLLLYLRSPLYGTVWILAIGQVTVFLAFGTRTMTAALTQLDRALEEGAAVHGAGPLATLRRVVAPLMASAAGNGWTWVAMHSVRDFTFPLMMGTTSNVVLAALIWNLWSAPDVPAAAALSVMLALVMAVLGSLLRGYVQWQANQA